MQGARRAGTKGGEEGACVHAETLAYMHASSMPQEAHMAVVLLAHGPCAHGQLSADEHHSSSDCLPT